MALWITSDLHFGHEKVAVETRGFNNTDAHDEFLIKQWKKRVRPDDNVIVAGDISSGSSVPQNRALEIMSSLPGNLLSVLGNHDGPHPRHGSASLKWEEKYREVFKLGVRTHHFFRHDGIRFIASHFPFDQDHTETPREMLWRFPRIAEDKHVLLHGHTHSNEIITSSNEIHIGADAWGLAPASIGEVAAKYREIRQISAEEVALRNNPALVSALEYAIDHPELAVSERPRRATPVDQCAR